MTTPYQPVDAAARALAQTLLTQARVAALGVIDPASGGPVVTRAAFGLVHGRPMLLLSDLSAHSRALQTDPRCSLLITADRAKGDPMTHPRLTLTGTATRADKAAGRTTWLDQHPKSLLYIDFADFHLLTVTLSGALLNAGFGRATHLTPADLTPNPA